MAANGRMVARDIDVTWDGAVFHVSAGTIVDIPAGGALETAYGSTNLVALSAAQSGGGGGDTQPLEA